MTIERKNHDKAWDYFVSIGMIPKDASKYEWVLHHKDVNLKYTDPKRYKEWRIEDLVPMLRSEHQSLHQTGENNSNWGKHFSDETKKKLSENHADVSGKNNPMYGKRHSEESRKKMSEAAKNRHAGEKKLLV